MGAAPRSKLSRTGSLELTCPFAGNLWLINSSRKRPTPAVSLVMILLATRGTTKERAKERAIASVPATARRVCRVAVLRSRCACSDTARSSPFLNKRGQTQDAGKLRSSQAPCGYFSQVQSFLLLSAPVVTAWLALSHRRLPQFRPPKPQMSSN